MRLACPTCRAPMDAPDTPGLKVICPACGQKVLLPAPKPAAQNRTVLASAEDLQLVTAPVAVPVSVVTAPAGACRPLAPWIIGGGSLVALLLLVAVALALTRTPTYSVADLVKAYHPGMKGQRVRVVGAVFLTAPDGGGGTFVELYEPAAQQFRVGSARGVLLARRLEREERVTLVGDVQDRVDLRPFTDHGGVRVIVNGSFVSLANAQVE